MRTVGITLEGRLISYWQLAQNCTAATRCGRPTMASVEPSLNGNLNVMLATKRKAPTLVDEGWGQRCASEGGPPPAGSP
jgi:hypothetical protein